MLIRFENSLDPDQVRQNVGPNLDPNGLTLQSVFNKYIAVQLQAGFINTLALINQWLRQLLEMRLSFLFLRL